MLETLKERLKETSIDPSVFDRLALLSDSDAYFPSIASDSESEEHHPSMRFCVTDPNLRSIALPLISPS